MASFDMFNRQDMPYFLEDLVEGADFGERDRSFR